MIFRDLEMARALIKDATGLDVMYAYEDLVFPEHGAFIIRFDDSNSNNFMCYFHEECIENESKQIFDNLREICTANKCTIESKGSYRYKQKGENFEVHFLN